MVVGALGTFLSSAPGHEVIEYTCEGSVLNPYATLVIMHEFVSCIQDIMDEEMLLTR